VLATALAQIEEGGGDVVGMGFDDGPFLVNGQIYCFKNKDNRDIIFNHVMKPA
jgi:hypothetical protein